MVKGVFSWPNDQVHTPRGEDSAISQRQSERLCATPLFVGFLSFRIMFYCCAPDLASVEAGKGSILSYICSGRDRQDSKWTNDIFGGSKSGGFAWEFVQQAYVLFPFRFQEYWCFVTPQLSLLLAVDARASLLPAQDDERLSAGTAGAGVSVETGWRVKATESMADRAAPAVVQPRLVRPWWFLWFDHGLRNLRLSDAGEIESELIVQR